MAGPLDGLLIADFTQLAQGPFATQMLGDMGADVVKIEPISGDWMRHFSYANCFPRGESISFISLNRNKRSITLNLKKPEGLEVAKRLIEKADVLVENFRPGVMDRLGIGYETSFNINPGIIYCSSSGFGPTGPYAKRPGQDLLIQSIAGTAALNGKKGELPVPTAVGSADFLTGMTIVQSILAALYSRDRTGKGQKLETCLLNSLIAFHVQELTSYLFDGKCPERSASGIPNPWIGAPYGIYKTKDRAIAIAMVSVKKIAAMIGCHKYNHDEFDDNNILHNRDQIRYDLAVFFKLKTTKEWLDILMPEDIWCSEVNTFDEMVLDPQVAENEMILTYNHPSVGPVRTTGFPVKFSGTPQGIFKPPPMLGEHSKEILKDLCKYTDLQIAGLIANGIFGEVSE